jgi:beta-glucosidase
MSLPGGQEALIRAVAAVNPKTAVAVNAGAPVAMDWVDAVDAVLLTYYPGQEGGNALADILFGDVNPSGKLTVTFPKRLEDNPAYINYPGWKDVHYGEGIFVGYRYYEKKDVEPLFPFGHGLSYTSFSYSEFGYARRSGAG